MSSSAQILANRENAQLSTGPRTAEGKETTSHNALANGLFTARDFVLPAERDEYQSTRASVWTEVQPQGLIEETLAAAVLTATWRLRRCGLVEAALADGSSLDPMQSDPLAPDASASRVQLSLDRARNQSLNQLRRALAELRRLQTDKAVHREIFETSEAPEAAVAGLSSAKEVLAAAVQLDRARSESRKLTRMNVMAMVDAEIHSEPPSLGLNCKAA